MVYSTVAISSQDEFAMIFALISGHLLALRDASTSDKNNIEAVTTTQVHTDHSAFVI